MEMNVLMEKISSLKSELQQLQQQQPNTTTTSSPPPVESYIPIAGQIVTNQLLYQQINDYLLSSVQLSSSTPLPSSPLQETFVFDYFYVLCEWYKSNNDLLKFPLLNHLPICLYIELMNKKHPLVDGTLLCIYNCEVVSRSKTEGKFRLFTNLYNNEKCIYNIAEANNMYNFHSGHSDSGSSQSASSPQLTQSALNTFNRNQQQIAAELKGTFTRDSKLPFITSSVHSCISVVLQVFISYMDVFDVNILLDMCSVIYRLTSGGMPYHIPSLQYLESLQQYSEHKQQQKEQRVEELSELTVEQIELEVQETVPVPAKDEKLFTQQQLHKAVVTQKSATEKLSHLQLLQIVLNNSNLLSQSPNPWPRVTIDKDVLNEFITIIKYCICSVKHLEQLAISTNKVAMFQNTLTSDGQSVKSLVYGAIYAMHARVLYEQFPELLLYTRSVLSIV